MHGATIKIVKAQQAKLNNNYKNTKLKLQKANAATWFNKMCKVKKLKSSYINIKINGQKLQDKKTIINAIRFRINQGVNALVGVIIKVILQNAWCNNKDNNFVITCNKLTSTAQNQNLMFPVQFHLIMVCFERSHSKRKKDEKYWWKIWFFQTSPLYRMRHKYYLSGI